MTGILKTTSLDYRQHYVSQCIYTRTNEEHIKDKKFNLEVHYSHFIVNKESKDPI